MPDPQDNRESRISDPMIPLYYQVAAAQREWHNAQKTIAGLKETQEALTIQIRELRDENNRLRSQIAKAEQSNSIDEGDAQQQRQTEILPETPQERGHGRGLVSEIVEVHNYQLSVPVDKNNEDERLLSQFARLCNPGPNNRYFAKNLLRFVRHGEKGMSYCFREVCEEEDFTVITTEVPTSRCPVHGFGCKVIVTRLKHSLGSKLTFRAFKKPERTAHEPQTGP